MTTYRPLDQPCHHCRQRPAEHGMWIRNSDGDTRHYCWACYQQITDTIRRDHARRAD